MPDPVFNHRDLSENARELFGNGVTKEAVIGALADAPSLVTLVEAQGYVAAFLGVPISQVGPPGGGSSLPSEVVPVTFISPTQPNPMPVNALWFKPLPDGTVEVYRNAP